MCENEPLSPRTLRNIRRLFWTVAASIVFIFLSLALIVSVPALSSLRAGVPWLLFSGIPLIGVATRLTCFLPDVTASFLSDNPEYVGILNQLLQYPEFTSYVRVIQAQGRPFSVWELDRISQVLEARTRNLKKETNAREISERMRDACATTRL